MRAVTFERFGEPSEVLAVQEVAVPELSPGTVRIRMLASPVNPSDLMTVRGVYGKQPALPAVPGYEGVGIVEQAQAGIYGTYLLGKRVAALNSSGGNWAEQVILPAKQVVPLDSRLSVEQGATFFVNPATAFILTRKCLAVPRGAWLLQSAAGSALGRMVIRLGRKFGFRTVNVVRRAEQVEELMSAGADAVIPFDGNRDDPVRFQRQVQDLVGSEGVKFAIDPVGGGTASAMVSCLGAKGRLLLYGTLSNQPISFSPRQLMAVGASVEGFWLSNFMSSQGLLGKLRLIRSITQLIAEGVLSSDLGDCFPLERVADAVRAAESQGKSGKIILRIGEVS
jgi:NADPH2:quinone reductase